jgi:hypothetical protein
MASSGFGPYHGMSLEDAQTKCAGVIPTPWTMTHALGLVQFPPQHEKAGPLQVTTKCYGSDIDDVVDERQE